MTEVWWAQSCSWAEKSNSMAVNPRSCSFNIGRGPRSTTWGTWRTSTPPGWAKTPSGLHRTELSAVEASLRDNHGLDQGRVGHHGIHLHQPPRILTPPTTWTRTLEEEFFPPTSGFSSSYPSWTKFTEDITCWCHLIEEPQIGLVRFCGWSSENQDRNGKHQ